MKRVDLLNAVGAVIILMFSVSYFLSNELGRAFTTLGISLILGFPVLFKYIKRRR